MVIIHLSFISRAVRTFTDQQLAEHSVIERQQYIEQQAYQASAAYAMDARRQLKGVSRRLMRHPSLSKEPAVLRFLQAEEQRVAELEAGLLG